MQLRIARLVSPSPDELPLEFVERKGRGHPDTLCDALAESVSVGLSRYYVERFGAILHHNVDKALLIGGAARPAFGGGEILEPVEITIAGRATRRFGSVEIPVDEIAVDQCRTWLAHNVRNADARNIRIVPRIRETSSDLAALFLRGAERTVPLANDTSFGVGFAPFDRLERAVLAVERRLRSADVRGEHPEIGDDVKIMGIRNEAKTQITVACAFVGRHVRDVADYHRKKANVRLLAKAAVTAVTAGDINIAVNAADGDSADSIYLTVTGLSAEAGDDGQVGRGNRLNGLITPYRPMSLEAVAGKNPVTHTGKLYNIVADRIARALVADIPGVAEAYCYLLSRIGSPITDPALADIQLRLADPASLVAIQQSVRELVRAHLDAAPELWRDIISGTCSVVR
ncbi:MAG: methionine adenosyltransferase [Burkholderiales bacterium]